MSTYLLPYAQGTISVENGSKVVTGSGTAFATNVRPGDLLELPAGTLQAVGATAVIANTGFELVDGYAGSTGSGLAYKIHRVSPGWGDVANLNARLAEIFTTIQTGFAMRSVSSVEIGTGEKEFTVPSAMPILPGVSLTAASAANPTTHWMSGVVTAYSGQTLVLEVVAAEGEGTRADWNINLAGQTGAAGPQGDPGDDGDNGWSPVLAIEADDDRRVLKVVDWQGGSGSEPASPKYVGASGLVDAIGDGVDVRGPAGEDGVGAFTDLTDAPASYAGHGGKGVAVDAAAGGLEFVPRREVLTSNRTYYVRTDGSDSNTGLANTSGGAFLTIQRAIEAAYALDCAISTVTISVQPGTYTAGATFAGPHLGGTNIVLSGSSATISTTNANCVSVSAGARVTVSGFTLQTTTAGYCILCTGGTVSIGANMSYGAAAGAFHAHLAALDGGLISIGASYSITGGAIRHLHADRGSTISAGFSLTVTISGTPAFTIFAEASGESVITTSGNTYSGSATGKRFNVTTNSALNVFSGALTLFPGNVAGTVASGGVYGSYLNWESINKTTDESTASDTTFSSDSQLQFTMLANSTYHVRGRVLFSTVAAADFKWQLTGPSSPTLVRIARRAIGGGDAAFSAVGVDTDFSTSVAVLGGGEEGFVEFDAAIQNGANAGTFAFQWAQNTSDAGNTTVRAGSYLEFIRMT